MTEVEAAGATGANKEVATISSTTQEDIKNPAKCTNGIHVRPSFVRNRWCCLVIMMAAMLLNVGTYFGWQQWALLLYSTGAYFWLCPQGTIQQVVSFSCAEQENAVKGLFTYATTTDYVSALAAGWLTDNIGLRRCGLAAVACFFLGNSAIWVSSRKLQLYIPGHMLAGAADNSAYIPALAIADDFPGNSELITSVLMASALVASALSPMMWCFHQRFGIGASHLWMNYLLFVSLPVAILYLLALPRNRERTNKDSGAIQPAESTGWPGFLRSWKPEVCAFALWYVLMIMQNNVYVTAVLGFARTDVVTYLGWLMPMQGICTVLIGLVTKYVGILPVCAGLTVANFIFVLTAISREFVWMQNANASSPFLLQFIYASKYCESQHFGKVSGTISCVAGLCQMINIPISQTMPTTDELFGTWTGISVLIFALIGFTLMRHKEQTSTQDLTKGASLLEDQSCQSALSEKTDLP